MTKSIIFIRVLYDPCISRIEKNLVNFCPKFLDLYASIYGSLNWTTFNVKNLKSDNNNRILIILTNGTLTGVIWDLGK
jgi:hypothetical protein